ncbi:MAG: hypothetical protein O7A98_05900 [Acidobacteria bacterium]|nr:hypothetical protein [Acidobacteriota bacterium]
MIDNAVTGGLARIEKVEIHWYRGNAKGRPRNSNDRPPGMI